MIDTQEFTGDSLPPNGSENTTSDDRETTYDDSPNGREPRRGGAPTGNKNRVTHGARTAAKTGESPHRRDYLRRKTRDAEHKAIAIAAEQLGRPLTMLEENLATRYARHELAFWLYERHEDRLRQQDKLGTTDLITLEDAKRAASEAAGKALERLFRHAPSPDASTDPYAAFHAAVAASPPDAAGGLPGALEARCENGG